MLNESQIVVLFAVVVGAYLVARTWRYGLIRGFLGAAFRIIWISALVSVFFPKAVDIELPPEVSAVPIHVFLDDSQSMKELKSADGTTFADGAERYLERLSKLCQSYRCLPEVTRLSQLAPEAVSQGNTPLKDEFERFLLGGQRERWVLLSDGGDQKPELPWSQELQSLKLRGGIKSGLVVGFQDPGALNYWVDQVLLPPFAFEGQNFVVDVSIGRSGDVDKAETVQVQVRSGDTSLATTNIQFREGDKVITAAIPVMPLSRGFHQISVLALPVAGEPYVWDNVKYSQIDVLADTVGVLHLLGSPSWDGRYLRRYLKGEPKYDLISFFILRDPTDSQRVQERELSLIPFPVERLFTEELPNFRLVIIQNFAMHQFLLPEYQKNLVDFVKNGGALLFIGGSRALFPADVEDTPLKEILPFSVTQNSRQPSGVFARRLAGSPYDLRLENGPAFDPQASFRMNLADPDWEKRSLAGVFDDWAKVIPQVQPLLSGRHRMEWVNFKTEDVTPLLVASDTLGQDHPLAVASYPGSGRAIWLFTDSLWQVAASGGETHSSQNYYDLVHSAMGWLLRQDLVAPLTVRQFNLLAGSDGHVVFRSVLEGPAAKYFVPGPSWTIEVCGLSLADRQVSTKYLADSVVEISGEIPLEHQPGERCDLNIKGKHKAFGSTQARSAAILPAEFSDRQIGSVPNVLQDLAKLTSASLTFYGTESGDELQKLESWLGEVTGEVGLSVPSRTRTELEHYWLLKSWWMILVVLALIGEVVLFRWRELSGRQT